MPYSLWYLWMIITTDASGIYLNQGKYQWLKTIKIYYYLKSYVDAHWIGLLLKGEQ